MSSFPHDPAAPGTHCEASLLSSLQLSLDLILTLCMSMGTVLIGLQPVRAGLKSGQEQPGFGLWGGFAGNSGLEKVSPSRNVCV